MFLKNTLDNILNGRDLVSPVFSIFSKTVGDFPILHTQSKVQSVSDFRTIEYTTLYESFGALSISEKTINIGKQSESFHCCSLITIYPLLLS